MQKTDALIERLGLIKHVEGGYYREIYKSQYTVGVPYLPPDFVGERYLATSILFLLPSNEVSVFHRLLSDELWYFHGGATLEIYEIDKKGTLTVNRLGMNLENGDLPQVLITAGSIFGAKVAGDDSFTLVGCMVTPGFNFTDFEMLARAELLNEYPQHSRIIKELTKP